MSFFSNYNIALAKRQNSDIDSSITVASQPKNNGIRIFVNIKMGGAGEYSFNMNKTEGFPNLTAICQIMLLRMAHN